MNTFPKSQTSTILYILFRVLDADQRRLDRLDPKGQKVALIIEVVAKKTGMPVCLIPHVTNPGSNDHEFMQRALSLINDKKDNIILISPKYNAAETK